MVEIHFKTFLPLAAASTWVVITAQSAPIGVVRSRVVRRGAVIRGGLSVQRSACHSSPQTAGSAGEWPATTAAPVKAGASTQLLSLCAHRSGLFTDSPTSSDTTTTPGAFSPAKSPRYALVYSGPSAKPVIGHRPMRVAFRRNALQQFANQRLLFL